MHLVTCQQIAVPLDALWRGEELVDFRGWKRVDVACRKPGAVGGIPGETVSRAGRAPSVGNADDQEELTRPGGGWCMHKHHVG